MKSRTYTQGARAQATEDTARRIVDAFLTRLMQQWFDEITLERVAEDAGVTAQTVIRRFGGKDGLLAESIKILATRIESRRAAPEADGRIESLVADYEETGDAVLRLLALEPRHPSLVPFLNFGRAAHRDWTARAFGVELGLDALVVVTDVYAWKLLRRDMGRSQKATVDTMKFMVQAIKKEAR